MRWPNGECPPSNGIKALIRDELARNGGQLPLDDLVKRITGRCKATPRSVAIYARQAPFGRVLGS
jgi:hypothetical protein